MAEYVSLERHDDGAIAVLTLDRSDKRNALSIAVRDEISDTRDDLAGDESLQVVIITGAGAVFSAGFDLREFETAAADPAFSERLWESSERYHATVATFPLPTIAAVNGPAIAGGFDLAVLCDVRVAATTARFSHPERTFGEVMYAPLRELIGGGRALELLFTGRTVETAEARLMGLVTAVVEPADLADHALATARTICAVPRPLLLIHKANVLDHSSS